MADEPIYNGTVEDAILETIERYTQQELGNFLTGEPTYELVKTGTHKAALMDMGGDTYKYSGRSFILTMVSAVSTLAEASQKKDKEIGLVTILQRLQLNDMKRPLSILYEGGFLKDNRLIFTTMSIGSVFDYSIDRGLGIFVEDTKATTARPTKSTDAEGIKYSGPLTSLLEIEAGENDSVILTLLNQLPWKSKYKVESPVSKIEYSIRSGPAFEIIPRQGKTIATVRTSAFKDQKLGISKCELYRMDWGQKKSVDFEVSVPYMKHILVAAKLLKRFENLPEYLKSPIPNTSDMIGGVDTVLALEIAHQIYFPGKSPLSLQNILNLEGRVPEVLGRMNTETRKVRVNINQAFPKYLVKRNF